MNKEPQHGQLSSETSPLLAQSGDTTYPQTGSSSLRSRSPGSEAARQPNGEDYLDPETVSASVVGTLAVLLIGVFVANADTSLVLATYGQISSEFNALQHASWLMTSYVLAMCGTQIIVSIMKIAASGLSNSYPQYGKLSNIFGCKIVLLTAYAIFGLGCFICGVATSMELIIFGRLVSGIGGAGMHSVVSFLIVHLVPARQVAKYRSYVNIMQTIGRSCGGPLGGYLAQTLGWRWSFLVQCPAVFFAFTLVAIKLSEPEEASLTEGEYNKPMAKLKRIDFLGTILLVAFIVAILLALNLGGTSYPWGSAPIIGLFASSVVLALLFAYVELRVAKEPIYPLYLFGIRDVILSYLIIAVQSFAQTMLMFTIPLYFQVTKSVTPAQAGSYLVPSVLGNTIGGLVTGHYITRTGNHKLPNMMAGAISAIAYALTTLRWTGNTSFFEALYIIPGGIGTGIAHSSTFITLSAAVDRKEVAIAGSGLYLSSNFGTILGFTFSALILNNVFTYSANRRLADIPSKDDTIRRALEDVNSLKSLAPALRAPVVHAYVDSMRANFETRERSKMADSEELRNTLEKTATSFIDCCNKYTVDAVLSLRTDTCKHTHLPSSLGIPTYNKTEYGAFYGQFTDMMKACSCWIADDKEMVVDVQSRKVVMHVKTKGNTPLGEYENEYMWILTMTEDGKMIQDIVEFCDSAKALELMKKQQAKMSA
ncbi:MFS general substrate transporter [Paramyrothecium foliicola]|nr:MFS general substrate transporter [Paramyrothecium foliicola]